MKWRCPGDLQINDSGFKKKDQSSKTWESPKIYLVIEIMSKRRLTRVPVKQVKKMTENKILENTNIYVANGNTMVNGNKQESEEKK